MIKVIKLHYGNCKPDFFESIKYNGGIFKLEDLEAFQNYAAFEDLGNILRFWFSVIKVIVITLYIISYI